jgi:hypothetical protein
MSCRPVYPTAHSLFNARRHYPYYATATLRRASARWHSRDVDDRGRSLGDMVVGL